MGALLYVYLSVSLSVYHLCMFVLLSPHQIDYESYEILLVVSFLTLEFFGLMRFLDPREPFVLRTHTRTQGDPWGSKT